MTKSMICVLSICLLGFSTVQPAQADGMMIAPRNQDIYESDQIAYLAYDANMETESLHILPMFRGDAQEFAWIVPLPSLPEIAESDLELFRDLSGLSAGKYRSRYWDQPWGCGTGGYVTMPGNSEDGIDVLDEQVVGIYQTMTVSALDAEILSDSLSAWGFIHEDNVDAVEPMLESYVLEGWYFVAMKVDSSTYEESGAGQYGTNTMQPMEFRFHTDAPVYPMRISALSASPYYTEVILYLNANHRMDVDGFETRYANRLNVDELTEIAEEYPILAAHLDVNDFLTKLVRDYHHPEEMNMDLYPNPSSRDSEYFPLSYSGIPMSLILLLVLGMAAQIWKRRSLADRLPQAID